MQVLLKMESMYFEEEEKWTTLLEFLALFPSLDAAKDLHERPTPSLRGRRSPA